MWLLAVTIWLNKYLSLLIDYHKRWSDLQEWAMASWVLHVHKLQHVTRWTTFYVTRRKTILRRMFWGAFCQAMHSMLQTNYRYHMETKYILLFCSIYVINNASNWSPKMFNNRSLKKNQSLKLYAGRWWPCKELSHFENHWYY